MRLAFQKGLLLTEDQRLPSIAFGPLEGRDHGGSRSFCVLQEIQRHGNDCPLHFRVVRLAARITEREVGKHHSRNAAMLYDISCSGDDDRRDAVLFEVPCDQTHGLVTYGSDGNENGRVDCVFPASP